MTTRVFIRSLFLSLFAAAFVGQNVALAGGGEEVEIEADLIWATDHEKAPDEDYTKIDPKLSKDLRKTFKWKNYFVIDEKVVNTPKGKKVSVKMSDQCRLKIKYVGNDMFEVWIYGKDPKTGEESAVAKGKQKIGPDQKIMLMGLNENESGWLVKLCRD